MASLVESAAYNSATGQIDLEPLGGKQQNGNGIKQRSESDSDLVELPPIGGRDPHPHLGRPEPALVLFFEVSHLINYKKLIY
jgi:hypothetical protein